MNEQERQNWKESERMEEDLHTESTSHHFQTLQSGFIVRDIHLQAGWIKGSDSNSS